MQALPRTARWYLYGIWAAAAVCLTVALPGALTWPTGPMLAVGLVAFVLADLFAVSFELRESDHFLMTVTDTVQVFLAGTLGPIGVVVPVLGSLLSDAITRRPWYKGLFNAAQRCLTYLAIAYTYLLVVGLTAAPFAGVQGLLAIVLMTAVYICLNTFLVSTIVALASSRPLLVVYASSLGQVQWVHLITLPLGAVLAVLATLNPWMLIPAVVPLMMAYRAFRTQASLMAESRKSKDLADKLERLQDMTTAMLASDEPLPLLELVSERLAALLDAPAVWVILDEREPRLVAMRGVDDPALIELATATRELRNRTVSECAPSRGPWRAVLYIPMVTGGRLVGGFGLGMGAPISLADDDRRVLLAFAAQTAVAVERTRLSEQLRSKQDELVRASKLAAMGTLAAGIAHEFNNLLTAIGGFAQLGLASGKVDEKDEALRVALRTSQRGQSITAGLLSFARRRDARRELCQLRDVANDTLVLVERQLARKNIAVVRDYKPAPMTFCDPGQIAQVLMNLITNARDAMAHAGGTLVVGLHERDGSIELLVADTGTGIPPELLPEIFKPFMTTKAALDSGGTSGTGLGLAITHQIVEEHNGTIEVISTLGQGTTVLVRLPVLTPTEELARGAEAATREVSA